MENKLFSSPKDIGNTFTQLTQSIRELGFDDVLYSFYPKPMYTNTNIQPVLHFSDGLSEFVSHYIKHDYGNCDFVLRLALTGRRDTIDWWEEIHSGAVSDAEKDVTIDAKDNFGIYNGLSIPVLFGTFAIAGISVVTKKPNHAVFQEIKQRNVDKLYELGDKYHRSIIKSKPDLNYFILPLLESLNTSKKKVLKHLMTGEPMKTIEKHHDITPRYAEKVLLNIRKEFGDISTNELMYILGMMNMHEYL